MAFMSYDPWAGNLAYLDASTGRADFRSVSTSNYRNYGGNLLDQ